MTHRILGALMLLSRFSRRFRCPTVPRIRQEAISSRADFVVLLLLPDGLDVIYSSPPHLGIHRHILIATYSPEQHTYLTLLTIRRQEGISSMIDQRHCNAPSSPPSSLTKPAFVAARPLSPSDVSSSLGNISSSKTATKNRIRARGERPSYLLPTTPTCATLPPRNSKSKPYTCNNDDTCEDDENCSITSQQPLLYEHQHHPPPSNRRRRTFLLNGTTSAAAAVVLLIVVASIMNTLAHGGSGTGNVAIRQLFPPFHRQGQAATAASADALGARDVLLMAEREALAFKRDAAGLQRTNDRLKAELSMPSQETEEEAAKAEARQ